MNLAILNVLVVDSRHNQLSTLNYSTVNLSFTVAVQVDRPAILLVREEPCSVKLQCLRNSNEGFSLAISSRSVS
jgi:hypothetical protein